MVLSRVRRQVKSEADIDCICERILGGNLCNNQEFCIIPRETSLKMDSGEVI